MTKYLVLPMLAVLGSTIVLSFFATTSVSAQDTPYRGIYETAGRGDRAEYLQELEHSDPLFYVPPVNDANFPVANNGSAN